MPRSAPGPTLAIAFAALAATGCWESHLRLVESDEGLLADGGPRDLAPRGTDLGPSDAGPPPTGCGELTVLDRDRRAWSAFEFCGPFSGAALVARGGAFDQIVRDAPTICDRAPRLTARSVYIEADRLTFGAESTVMDADPRARGLAAAADGETLLLAAGTDWRAFTGDYEPIGSGSLGMVPESVPGCVFRLDVTDLVRRPTGWFAAFDYFECDVGGARHRFYETDALTPITETTTVWPGIGDAVAWGDGASFIARARRDVDTLLTWIDEPGAEPRTRAIPASGEHVAMDRWPSIADGVAIAFLARETGRAGAGLTLLIVDAEGEVLHRSETSLAEAYDLVGYQPTTLALATTDFGGVVSVGLRATGGGRSGGALVVLGFDRRARRLEGALVETDLDAEIAVPIAAVGDRAVVSVVAARPSVQTFLFGCAP